MSTDSIGGLGADRAYRERVEGLTSQVGQVFGDAGLAGDTHLPAALVEYLIARAPNVSALRALRAYVLERLDDAVARRERADAQADRNVDGS
jgi:hypothetical protein